jgi:hypothetical protein
MNAAEARRRAQAQAWFADFTKPRFKPQNNGGVLLPIIAFFVITYPGALIVWIVWSMLK